MMQTAEFSAVFALPPQYSREPPYKIRFPAMLYSAEKGVSAQRRSAKRPVCRVYATALCAANGAEH